MPNYRITGKKAAIDGLQCLTDWQLIVRGLDTVSACSASDGGVLRTAGNADWMGSAKGYGLPQKYPGDVFTFTGSDRDGQGWQSAANGAIVSKVKVHCPIRTGRHIFHTIEFAATGSLSKGAYSATDVATPSPLNPKGLSFTIDSAGVNGVEYWELEIDAGLTDPTWGSDTGGWPKRAIGDVDATVAWLQTFDAANQIQAVNAIIQLGLYVTASTYYDVKWAQVLSSQPKYPIEGDPPGKGEWVMHQTVAKFTGFSGGVQGYIKKPGATDYWPT